MKIKTLANMIFLLSIPFVYITVLTTAHAGELYNCIDKNGNELITSVPQDGMKCELKVPSKESTTERVAEKEKVITERDNSTEKSEDARVERIKKCFSCCDNKQQVCYNYTADGRLCGLETQNCISTCNSEGTNSSSWSECWSQSDK